MRKGISLLLQFLAINLSLPILIFLLIEESAFVYGGDVGLTLMHIQVYIPLADRLFPPHSPPPKTIPPKLPLRPSSTTQLPHSARNVSRGYRARRFWRWWQGFFLPAYTTSFFF